MDRALLDLTIDIAHRAGRLLLRLADRDASGVGSKTTPTDLVSDADRASEELILAALAEARPGDRVLTEEGPGKDGGSGLLWIVDPLDGTVNYLFRLPHWCVSIGVHDENGGLVGVIYDPNRDETFAATRGGGAALDGTPIHVSDRKELSGALIGTGFSYDSEARAVQAGIVGRILPRARDVRRMGSAALDLANLACGRLDGYYEAPAEPWDKAAGTLIVREAGGVVTEMPPPKEGLSPGVIAANPHLHPQLEELVLGSNDGHRRS